MQPVIPKSPSAYFITKRENLEDYEEVILANLSVN